MIPTRASGFSAEKSGKKDKPSSKRKIFIFIINTLDPGRKLRHISFRIVSYRITGCFPLHRLDFTSFYNTVSMRFFQVYSHDFSASAPHISVQFHLAKRGFTEYIIDTMPEQRGFSVLRWLNLSGYCWILTTGVWKKSFFSGPKRKETQWKKTALL